MHTNVCWPKDCKHTIHYYCKHTIGVAVLAMNEDGFAQYYDLCQICFEYYTTIRKPPIAVSFAEHCTVHWFHML